MKCKIACIAIAFACIMMLVHAVLPHHHHCHDVVFSAQCQWEQKLIGNHDTSCFILVLSDEGNHHCPPFHSHDDPCWKNTKYVVQQSIHIPSSAISFLFAALLPADSRQQSSPIISPLFAYSDYYFPYHQDAEIPGFGFRAPPFC